MVNDALSKLRMRHPEQISLLSILCGTRYKYYQKGILLPMWRPNGRGKQRCSVNDSFRHMLQRYDLNKHVATGLEAVKSLALTARRTLPKGLPKVRSRYIEV